MNGRIRAREVRLIGEDGTQVSVISLADALALAKAAKLDLVEVSSNAKPPVCRLVDFAKYSYELSKKGTKSD
jgi:translation initiation factor IF-3